jgi:parallel beta-helix repeat protein
VMESNMYNFGVGGSVFSDLVNNVSTSNLVDGRPVYYLMNRSNIMISPETCPEGVGYVGLVSCKNVTVQGLALTKNSQGLLLAYTNDSKITDNNVTANYEGVDLYSSSGNVLSGNNVTANGFGIFGYGILLDISSGNVLSGNNVRGNSGDGVYLSSSSDNMFFHNNFVNNTYQVSSDGSPNTWDNGYPSGGNYWSNYRTLYPNAAEVDSSAIWNASYVIDANNTDRYPLMGPFHTFDVGTWNGTAYSVDTVSNSTITSLSFNATLKTLTFNVTGANGTMGFCRVGIPLSFMSGEWTVTVNGTQPQNLNITTYGNYTYVYFTYHHSTETVQIQSTSAIPEFQSYMLLPLLMMITLLTTIVSKKKRKVAHVTKSAKE